MRDKVTLNIYLIDNVISMDIERKHAKEIFDFWADYRRTGKYLYDFTTLIRGENFCVLANIIQAITFGKPKVESGEEWKSSIDDSCED